MPTEHCSRALGTPRLWRTRPRSASTPGSQALAHSTGAGGAGPSHIAPRGRQETVMSTGSKLLLFALAATFVAAGVPTAKAAPRPPLCTAGRFAVSGTPLLGPGGEILVLENRNISIGSLCQARHAKLRRQKKGTAVVVVFPKGQCAGVNAKVRVKALITDNCSVLTGTLRTKGQAPANFTAAASVCGDGVVDPGTGEACDGSATGCQAGEACTNACQCLPTRADKSSPSEITPDGQKVG